MYWGVGMDEKLVVSVEDGTASSKDGEQTGEVDGTISDNIINSKWAKAAQLAENSQHKVNSARSQHNNTGVAQATQPAAKALLHKLSTQNNHNGTCKCEPSKSLKKNTVNWT